MLNKLNQFIAELREDIEIPNAYLPASYHSKRGYRTLASLEKEITQKQIDPRTVKNSAERLGAIESYRKQVENGFDIEYIENEDKLYKNQMAFAAAIQLDVE